jgi:hypothetical protein
VNLRGRTCNFKSCVNVRFWFFAVIPSFLSVFRVNRRFNGFMDCCFNIFKLDYLQIKRMSELVAHNCPDPTHRFLLCIYIFFVTFLNLMLMHFIRCKTSDCMKEYRIILYATTLIDFTSAWTQCLIGIVRFLYVLIKLILYCLAFNFTKRYADF